MGNQLAGAAPLNDSRTLLQDLENYVFRSELGGTRVFKSIQCVNEERQVTVKVYAKQRVQSLSKYEEQYAELRRILDLSFSPNVMPYPRFFETDKAYAGFFTDFRIRASNLFRTAAF